MRRPSLYAIFWTCAALVFAGGVWLIVRHAPVPTERNTLNAPAPGEGPAQPGAKLNESLGTTNMSLSNAELTVSSPDGKMQMKVTARSGRKTPSAKGGALYSIDNGAVQFSLKSKATLRLVLQNATYESEGEIVRVKGTLLGYIAEGGQYFRASELTWDQTSQTVTTREVRYVGPSVEVTGEKMHVNLATGQVRFDGPVEVGI